MPGERFDPGFRDALVELFRWRRDVRHFSGRLVAEADMLDLLRIAQLAPSVGNSQPWRFVRVRSTESRAALADHVDTEAARPAEAYHGERRDLYRGLKLHGLREAPEIVAAYCDDDTPAGAGLGAATMPEARAYSVVLAIHTLWLAARARGIALGWISIVDPDAIGALLAVPARWRLIGLVCLGYPLEEAETPELERRGWQDRIDWSAHVSER